MKTPKSIFPVIALTITLFSCKKNDVAVEPSCKTYNIGYEGFEKLVNYQGCNGATYTTSFNQTGIVEAKEGTLKIFEFRYNVAIENNSSIFIRYIDSYESNTVDTASGRSIKSTGDFVLKYDDSKVTKQYAEIWKDGEKVETRILTDGSTKFISPLKSGATNIIKVFNGIPAID